MRTGLLRKARSHPFWRDPLLDPAGNQSINQSINHLCLGLVASRVACHLVTVVSLPGHLLAEPQSQRPHVPSDRTGHRNQ